MNADRKSRVQVLLIEDNPAHIELFSEYAKRSETWVISDVAKTLKQAFEKIDNQHFDLALVDLNLPDSQGLDSLRKLQQVLKDTPWVVLTSFENKALALEALALGAEDFLVKLKTGAADLERAILYAKKRYESSMQVRHFAQGYKQFINVLSHDFRAPIRQLRFFSEFLSESIEKKDFKESLELSQKIHESTTNLTALFDVVTQFSIAAKPEPQLKRVSLSSLVEQVKLFLEPSIKSTGAKIEIASDTKVLIDPYLGYLLLQNLAQNALRYVRNGKTPQIRFEAKKREDQTFLVEVSDNGMGIDSKDWETIFEPSVRLHHSEDNEGFGHGLALCKKIVDLHQGKIGVRSRVGEGSCFYFSLPNQKEAAS